jgi:2-polyprenyl-3-methyl-5-hydroxy-6-metoxy-1,4-benzoquinol methylase
VRTVAANAMGGTLARMERAEFEAMAGMDERHWWYRGRRAVVRAMLDELDLPPAARILDAGCGSGLMLDELERYGTAFGVDSSSWAVAAARGRRHARVELATLEQLPYANGGFDLVTCLDVLEHVPDDEPALAELWRVTAPGGHLLLTVPAYQTLWSAHDVANHHFRRYRMRTLRVVALDTGWEIRRTSYFNSVLLPAAALVRVVRKLHKGDGRSELSLTPAPLDRVLALPLRLEAQLLRLGMKLPAGLSLLTLLQKPAPVEVPQERVQAIPRSALEPALPG